MQHRRRALWVLFISIAQGLEHKFLIKLFQRNSKKVGGATEGEKNKRWFLCLCWGNSPLLWKRLVIQSALNPKQMRESRMISTLLLPPPELLFIPIWRENMWDLFPRPTHSPAYQTPTHVSTFRSVLTLPNQLFPQSPQVKLSPLDRHYVRQHTYVLLPLLLGVGELTVASSHNPLFTVNCLLAQLIGLKKNGFFGTY